MRPWTAATVTTYLMISVGRIVAHFAETTPGIRSHPELADALTAAQAESDRHWTAVATAVDSDRPAIRADPTATDGGYPRLPRVTTLEDARSLVISTWIVDWVRHLDRLSTTHDETPRRS